MCEARHTSGINVEIGMHIGIMFRGWPSWSQINLIDLASRALGKIQRPVDGSASSASVLGGDHDRDHVGEVVLELDCVGHFSGSPRVQHLGPSGGSPRARASSIVERLIDSTPEMGIDRPRCTSRRGSLPD